MHGMEIKNRSIKASRGFMHMRYIIHIHFLAFAAIFIGLIGLIFSWSQEMITKPVQAATTQIDNVIQSTMSAILRK